MRPLYRLAGPADIPDMMEIRNGVRENTLVSLTLTANDYLRAMTVEGTAWVSAVDGAVVGFVCGRPVHRDIWALFVLEAFEGRGIGTGLMDIVEPWMFAQGVDAIVLSTAVGTRAEGLYVLRGWAHGGSTPGGDAIYTLAAARGS